MTTKAKIWWRNQTRQNIGPLSRQNPGLAPFLGCLCCLFHLVSCLVWQVCRRTGNRHFPSVLFWAIDHVSCKRCRSRILMTTALCTTSRGQCSKKLVLHLPGSNSYLASIPTASVFQIFCICKRLQKLCLQMRWWKNPIISLITSSSPYRFVRPLSFYRTT